MASLVTLLLFIAAWVSSAQAYLRFTTPPNVENVTEEGYGHNPTYKIGSMIPARWESNDTKRVDFYLFWLHPIKDGLSQVLERNTTATTYNWTSTLDGFNDTTVAIPKSNEYVVSFVVTSSESEDTEHVTYSQPFNLTMSSGSGLSTGAVAGIAVGSTIGGLLFLGGLGYLAWRSSGTIREFMAWRKSKRAEAGEKDDGTTNNTASAGHASVLGDGIQSSQLSSPIQPKFEAPGQHPAQSPELPSPEMMQSQSVSDPPKRHRSLNKPGEVYEAP